MLPPKSPIVNSWNEWDPLEECIVGVVDGSHFPEQPDVTMWFSEQDLSSRYCGPSKPYPQKAMEVAKMQLDGLAELLESEGVIVHRPQPAVGMPIKTPYFETGGPWTNACPRDPFIVIGSEILGAPMASRCRYFEQLAYNDIFNSFSRKDPNFLWTNAPRPRLSESSFSPTWFDDYEKKGEEWAVEQVRQGNYPTKDKDEILFDAADALRFGRDILMQRSAISNNLGVDWVRRYVAKQGLRLHVMESKNDDMPWHLDASMMPLRKDFLLLSGGGHTLSDENVKKMFKDNEWDCVQAPEPLPIKSMGYGQCTDWLAVNMFSLSPRKVIVEAGQREIIDMLEDNDFDVIPFELFAINDFGGGLHCATLDIRRKGTMKDYLPDQTNAPPPDERWKGDL